MEYNTITNKDILMDVLTSIKSLAGIYHHFSLEASNDFVFDIARDLNEEICGEQRDYYNTLVSKGWYKVETEPANKINQQLTKFENCKAERRQRVVGETLLLFIYE